MNTKFLALVLFATMFLSSIMQPFLSANSLNDRNNQKAEGFELIYDNSTCSIRYPLEKSLKRNVTVMNTGDTYLELEFTYYFLELNATWPGWPWRVYLDPSETQTLWVLLDPFWGDFGSSPGNYVRTIEVKGYPVENPSSPIAKSVTLYNLVTVISQDNVTKNSLVYGYVYDNATRAPVEGVEVELLAASSIYSLRGGTQMNGSYSIPCPAHNFTVRLEVPGYETFHKIIHTPENTSIQVDAYLDKATETANYTLTKTVETTLPLWRYDVSDDEKYFAASQGHFENVGAWFPNLTEEYIENNSYIYLFSLSNDSLLWQYPVHGEVWCVDASEDGNYVAAPIVNSENVILLSRSGNIVWDTNELGYEHMLSDEVKISNNNKYIAIGYNPGYLCLLNLSTGEKIWGSYTPFTEGQITQIVFNEDDTHIYVGSGDGYLYLFNTSNGAMIWRTYIGTWPYRIHSLAVTPDESYIATGGKLGEVCLIDRNGTLLWNFDMMGCVFWVDISPDKKYVTVNSGGWYGSAVFDIEGNMLWYDSRLACGGSVATADGRKYMLGGTGPNTYAGIWNQNGTALWSYHGEIPCGCLFYMTKNCTKMVASAGDGNLYFFEGGITNLQPNAVTLNQLANITANSMLLSWSQNTDRDFANYTIYQSTTPGILGKTIVEIGSNARTWYNETSLLPNTTYYFTVRVYDFFGVYSDSNQVNGTTLEGWSYPNISIEFHEIPSCVLPLDVNLQHRFIVTNTGNNYEVFDLDIYCTDTDQHIACHPQPQRFFLCPGESHDGEVTLVGGWGGLEELPVGEWDRTLEFEFENISTYPSTTIFTVSKNYPITVLDSNNITGNFTINGRIVDQQGNPLSGCNAGLMTIGYGTPRVVTPDNGSFSLSMPYNKKWLLSTDGYGIQGKFMFNLDPNTYYEVVLSPQEGPEYELVKNITTNIGFWRGRASADGQHIMLLQGMENWEDTSLKNQSKIMLYTIDGEKEWEYSMGWESWGGDLSRDAKYAVYVTAGNDNPQDSELALLNATNGSLIWKKAVTEANFPRSDYGIIASLQVRLSNNNSFIGFGTIGGDFYLLDRETGNISWQNWTKGQIREVLFNSNDSAVYVGSGDGYLYKYATSNGTLLWKSWIESWPFVEGVKLSPDERLIASVGKSGEITLIRTDNGSQVWSYHGGGNGGYCAFSPNGSYLATAVGSSFSYLFDIEGNLLSKWFVTSCGQFTSDGQYIIAPLQRLGIYSLDGIKVLDIDVGSPSQSQFVYLTSDDEKLVFATRDMPSSGGVSIAFFNKTSNIAPVASFTYSPGDPMVNETMTFDAFASYDTDGTIVNYEWDFGDENITNTAEPIITHSYSSAGNYVVDLIVTDDDGATNLTSKVFSVEVEFDETEGDWEKEEGIRVPDGVSSCRVVISNATTHIDTYRMYYTGVDGIYSAFSDDGLNWIVEDGVRVSPGEPGSNQEGVCNCAVIGFPGCYRMIYEGVQGNAPNDIHRFFSANSTDGLNWVKEDGIRLESVGTSDYGQVSVPDIIYLFDPPNASVRMYYVGDFYHQGVEGNSIRSAISHDFGLTWTREGSMLLGEDTMDPDVIKRGGEYRMFYTSSPLGQKPGNLTVYSALSEDGLTWWWVEFGSRVAPGGKYDLENCMDPDVFELPNGSYRMYYSGMNPNGEINILSALRMPFSIEGNFSLDFSETQFNFTYPMDRLYFRFKCTNTGTKSIFGNMEECSAPAEEGGSYVHVATPQGTNFLAPGESTWIKIILGSEPYGKPPSPEGTYNFTLYMRCSAGLPDRIQVDAGGFFVNKTLQIKVINRTTLAGNVVLQGRIVDENGFPVQDLEFDIGTYGGKTGTRTDADGYFSYSIAESQAYFLVIQNPGYRAVTIEIDGNNVSDFYNIILTKETSSISVNSTLINSVTGNIGFWRCAATADESKLLLVNGMENWEDPSLINQSKLYLLDVNTGKVLWTHNMSWQSWTADITDDGKYAVFGSNLQWPETGPEGFINFIRLLNGTDGSTIWQKNITSENFPEYFKDGQSYTRGVKFSHNGEYIIVAVEFEYVYLINRSDGSVKWRKWVSQNVREILFTQDDQYVYISGGNGQLYKVRVNDGSEVWKQWAGAWACVNGLDLSSDEQYIAVAAKGATLSVINTTNGSIRFSGDGYACRFSPDGSVIAVGRDAPPLKILDLDGNLLWGYYMCNSQDIRFSGDSSLIFIGSGQVFNTYGTLLHEIGNTQGGFQVGWLNSNATRFVWAVRDTPASENNIIEVYSIETSLAPQFEEGDWIKESGIRIAEGSVPYVLRLDNGSYRLYYNNPNGIFSAISEDGLNFIKESGVRLNGTGIPGDPEWQAHGATVVKLDNGSYRMYYIGATGDGGPGHAIHRIYSAISNDGLNFVREGIRIESNGTIDNGWASVPEIVRTFDGKYRLYYCTMGACSIGSAISDDGLNFVREYGPGIGNGTGVYGADPAVCKLPNGTYRMFFTEPGEPMPPWYLEKGIYSAWSEDGMNFTLESGVRVLPGGIYDSSNVFDPAVIQLPNGSFRMYYGGQSDMGVVTLSAISPEILVENQPPVAYIDSISPNPATQAQTVTFTGHGYDSDGSIVAFNWRSSMDGQLSTSASFSTSTLSVGTHTIYFKVQDNNWTWSNEVSEILVVNSIGGGADTALPEIKDVQVVPESQIIGGYVNITCTVTDNIGINIVKVNITYPNGETKNITMTQVSSNSYSYNASYSVLGSYSYYIWTDDINNNQNKSSAYQFNITVSGAPAPISIKVSVDGREVNITGIYTGTINVTSVALPQAPPENLHYIGIQINVTIIGTLTYANITIKYNNSDVENIDETKLRMYYWDGSQWQLCNNSGVDTVNNIVWANVTHLTIFAPMAERVSAAGAALAPVNLFLYAGITAVIVILAVSLIVIMKRRKKSEETK